MNDYQDWRLTLELRGPLGSPMQSDTLFGHLCWQVAHWEGDDAVADFLEPFAQGQPPFVLSDAFPFGLLPRPLLPRSAPLTTRPEDYAAGKQWDKAPFLAVTDFLALLRADAPNLQPVPDPWRLVNIPHAAIDRRIDTTGGEDRAGRLFFTEARVLPHDSRLHLYLRTLPAWRDRVLQLLAQVGRIGFGRDKSTGHGLFALAAAEPWQHFQPFDGADAFVCLSTLMPARNDPTQGRWRLRIKRGYLGEQAAANPFKRPMIQFEPGAVFRTGRGAVPQWCGRLVPAVAPAMPQAVQAGFGLTVPCCWR